MLLAGNLPADYQPKIEGWTIVRVSETDPTAPPSQVRVGETEYHFDYHLLIRHEGIIARWWNAAWAMRRSHRDHPDAGGCTTPSFLGIDRMEIRDNSAEVEIGQNSSPTTWAGGGTKYTAPPLRQNVGGCRVGAVWMS